MTSMISGASFHKALVESAECVAKHPAMSEGSVYDCFMSAGFFQALGYKDLGIDILSHETVPGGRTPDYTTRLLASVLNRVLATKRTLQPSAS